MWSAQQRSIEDAFLLEKQIQNWSRAKREALIEGRYADLPSRSFGYSMREDRGG